MLHAACLVKTEADAGEASTPDETTLYYAWITKKFARDEKESTPDRHALLTAIKFQYVVQNSYFQGYVLRYRKICEKSTRLHAILLYPGTQGALESDESEGPCIFQIQGQRYRALGIWIPIKQVLTATERLTTQRILDILSLFTNNLSW